ncbi:tyrosine-protein phosphatase [Niastella yeongjuensis]|nr:tyrosine-protein phosphatase [Niastella yeongjuensis]
MKIVAGVRNEYTRMELNGAKATTATKYGSVERFMEQELGLGKKELEQ